MPGPGSGCAASRSGSTPWGRYSGRVEDPAGQPVEGAEVRVVGGATGDRALMPSSEKAVSGPGGVFAISASDGATLEARHPGFLPGRATLDFAARSSRRVVLKLGAAATRTAPTGITGRVLSGGAPVDGALVSARLLQRGGPGSAEDLVAAQATSDAEGRFTLGELGPGRHLLTASREGFAQARAVVARAGEEATIELGRGGTVVGRGPGGGERPARSRPSASRSGAAAAAGSCSWAPPPWWTPRGASRSRTFRPGPVTIGASAPGHLPSPEVEATIPEHPGVAEVELRLRPGRARLRAG